MPVYTIEQMRELESLADAGGHSYATMMELAGQATARLAIEQTSVTGRPLKVLVFAGPGNNGGDGLVAAKALANAGHRVIAMTVARGQPDPLADVASAAGVTVSTDYQHAAAILSQVDVVIDALFGTGLSRPISGPAAGLLGQLAAARARRRFLLIGVDGPSGLYGNTGEIDGNTVAVDESVTFGGVKVGMIAPNAVDHVGRIWLGDIGIPAKVTARVSAAADWLDVAAVSSFLPKRSRAGHKGTFGTVMIVGGSLNYVGAPALSAFAAGRSGAGLVTLAVPLAIHPMLAARADLTSATWLPLAHDFGAILKEAAETVHGALEKIDALVVGPGLGAESTTQQFVYSLLNVTDSAPPKGSIGFVGWRDAMPPDIVRLPPTVVDADGLNALAAYPGEWWGNRGVAMVLTPHPAELGRLLDRETAEIQANRLESVKEAAARFGQVVVLKGAYSVVAAPDGRVAVNSTATSALAKAGTGDVLAGVIGALLAQGAAPYEAACLGVVAHGRAGERLAERGGLATDLVRLIGEIWQEFEL